MVNKFIPDLTQTSTDIFLGLLNNDNGTQFTTDTIRIGTPVVNPEPTIARDTRVVIYGINSYDDDNMVLFYDRLKIETLPSIADSDGTTIPILARIGTAVTIADLLSSISEEYEINIQPEDIVSKNIDMSSGAVNTLLFAQDVLTWQGELGLLVLKDNEYVPDIVDAEGVSRYLCVGDDSSFLVIQPASA